MKVTISFTES